MPSSRAILVFLKYPTPGKVKSRLGKTIGFEESARVYRRLVSLVLEQVGQAPHESVTICYDPPDTEIATRKWLGSIASEWSFLPQVEGDLGDRLLAGTTALFANGARQVAVIGTDCIDLTATTFQSAWEALDAPEETAVFGPTFDGGYYLLGLNAPCPTVFTDIPWSADNTLEVSIAAAKSANFAVQQLERLCDIDEEVDLEAARVRGLEI